MSNSVVKVTDTTLSDSLLLLVGVDGTVTPSKEVVEAYLTSRTDTTNLQVMHINTSDNQSIEVDVDTMLYIPDTENKPTKENNFDEIAYNLYNIQLDHDYISHCEPPEEVDELAKTLSLLDGSEGHVSDISRQVDSKNDDSIKEINYSSFTSAKSKIKVVNTQIKTKQQQKKKVKGLQEKFNIGSKNDKDEEHVDTILESDNKLKTEKKISKTETKSLESFMKPIKSPKSIDEVESRVDFKIEKPLHGIQESKTVDKKQLKKDRKVTKAVPEDFALFSTPDIIRRVGGKEVGTTNSPVSPVLDSPGSDSKPAKIESRSKSASDTLQSPSKQNRLSLDDKVIDKLGKVDNKSKEKKYPEIKPKKLESIFKKNCEALMKSDNENATSVVEGFSDNAGSVSLHYESKSYGTNIPINTQNLSCNDQNITLDSNSLDLDPTLLDNINNDLISDDILYQVAQSLVSNTELQNAIDKSLNEEELSLEPAVRGVAEQRQDIQERSGQVEHVTSSGNQKGTQIVRPDGRIVVIPPIERPTTRSRNKKQEDTFSRLVRKPLDEEHVSGNELDSSGEEEEESEDDPNKLWCICNQPHNNRFMICCDTCEEWYHGKCVNITKAMGQQMEAEGKEWICLFCKDPNLKRPQAAAKRIRKASRNSRQSSDSTGSVKMVESKQSCVPCVVCQKPSRSNSIFCSEACILVHAQGVERVVVFERSTGNMLTGNRAPSAANLEQWLKDHPGYEVVRSAGKIVTTKQPHNILPSKLKIIKNVSKEVNQNKQITVSGEVKTVPQKQNFTVKSPPKGNIGGVKILNKQISTTQLKEKSNVMPSLKESDVSSLKSKTLQPPIKPGISPGSKEKSVPTKLQKVRSNEQVSSNITQPKQENIRENVQKTIFEQLTNRLKMAEDLKLSEDELKNISNEIESQLYKCFGDTGQKYRNKYRSLIFNIKDVKNQTLWRRICEKSINPYQLVRLSPDDLASQELALWREREAKHQLDMIKKSELELLQCNRQYVLKTHKGEQILEDNRPTDHIDSTEVITGLTDASTGEKFEKKRDYSKDNERKGSKHSHKDKERKSNREKTESKSGHRSHRSTSGDRDRSRKRSRSRDRNSKYNDKRRSRSRSRGRDRHRRSHKSSKHKRDRSSTDKLDKKSKEILEQLVDSKIVPPLEDRLWKHVSQDDILPAPLAESDSDHEPTSTVTIPTPPHSNEPEEFIINQALLENKEEKNDVVKERTEVNKTTSPPLKINSEEIWRGIINMIDVAQISITAHEVSGDCNGLAAELPPNLDIVGRISPDTVWDYIGKMKCSNSKIISIVRLNAINVEEKMPYLALYSYLSSRNRLGVVKSTNKAVKDFYILPLASQKPIPQALLPLNGPGFEEARPALLLGIIVRDKRKRPFFDPVTPLATTNTKKIKTEPQVSFPTRSYTPPPIKDNRRTLPLPPSVTEHDGDEPYSPEDSDPDSAVPATPQNMSNNNSANFLESETSTSQTFQPFVNKFDDIPGLDNTTLPSSTQEIQRQMEKLNKEIEMQKSEINSISQNIATASTGIGSSALANIALPSNLQQILDSIKTIGSTPSVDCVENKPQASSSSQDNSEFTIPLILPTTFSRHSSNSIPDITSENTIPLNLPSKKKILSESDKTNSVLSSLSEEDLIRKAEEMLEETQSTVQKDVDSTVSSRSETSVISTLEPE